MLRRLRILAALSFFVSISLLFVDVSGTFSPHWSWLAKVQIVPALLAFNVFILLCLFALSLFFGRVYCSIICPLGVLQDILASFWQRRSYTYKKPLTLCRWAFFLVFVASWPLSLPLISNLLEPYSVFGRIATDIFAPIWTALSNVLADVAEYMDSFAIGPSPLLQKGVTALGAAIFSLALLIFLALRNGRTWCNTVCPVGTFLGQVNRLALVRPRMNENCTSCGLCSRKCKASCIDSKEKRIDASRCVACFTCHSVCKFEAIKLLPFKKEGKKSVSKEPLHASRRAFVKGLVPVSIGGLALAGNTKAATYGEAKEKASGNQRQVEALSEAKSRPERERPIRPPGSVGQRYFIKHCTGCQLCVAACPHNVLRSFDRGLASLQPTMSFEHGFCRITCVDCSKVCPTGAILPINPADRSLIQCGQASIDLEACIVNADGTQCTACSRICPTDAINLVQNPRGGMHKIPVVDNEQCIGCGACEYVCPVRPLAAVQVRGNILQRTLAGG